jgi:hypothetical protein
VSSSLSSPDRTLLEAIRRFEYAAEPDLIERRFAWPEMAHFVATSWKFGNAKHRFATNQSIEADDLRWSMARRMLRSSLISPAHPDVGLVGPEEWPPLAEGELGRLQSSVRQAATALVAGPHRSLDVLQEFFTDDAKLRWPKPGRARVVVPNSAVEGTMDALRSLTEFDDVEWDVCSITDAKRKDSCDVTVIVGPPELFEGWRTEESLRPRRVGWLFNAPMSPHIVSITWSGSKPLNSERFEPYSGADIFDGRRWVDNDIEQAASEAVPLDDHEARPTSASPRPPASSNDSSEIVEAIDFELPGGRWISFGVETGPRARRIDDDSEFDIVIESAKATGLRRGNTLVIMSSTDDRDLRNRLCFKWLSEQPDRPSFDEASQTIDAYKSAARRYLARSESIRELGRFGLSEQYVRSQFQRSHPRSPHMAPQTRENFELIAQAAQWGPPADAWAHVKALRAGFMHAGRVIVDLLAEHVAADRSWIDFIDQRELAEVEVDGVGVVTLAPILAVAPDRLPRHVNELGEIIRP